QRRGRHGVHRSDGPPVIDLKRGEAKFVLGCVSAFALEFERSVVCVLASERRRVAEQLERPLAKASSPGAVAALNRQVWPYDAMLRREPFADAKMQDIPRLTD